MAMLLGAPFAHAGALVTITAVGTIVGCDDNGTLTGVIGAGGCMGKTVTMAQVFDTGAAPDTSSPASTNAFYDSLSTSITVAGSPTFTMDGQLPNSGYESLNLDSDAGTLNSQMTLQNAAEQALLSVIDMLSGIGTSNPLLLAGVYASGGATFGAEFSDKPPNLDLLWYFRAEARSITIDVTRDATVPEPATAAVMLLALGLLMLTRGSPGLQRQGQRR